MFGSFSVSENFSVFTIFSTVFRFLVGPSTLLLVLFFCVSVKNKINAHLIPTTRCSWIRVRIRMTSRSDQFCNNIKLYHKKREDQFYDFVIKDKDGAEIGSHKFILASQSEYFAALFRTNPNVSETTFQDFSIDVIKECIAYFYVLELNLTCENFQDVLMFADFITLREVIAICTDYIIENIDESNYASVIEFGNSRGMYRLVEAGVLFALRNLTRIESLDELTKAMIIKVADQQQQQPVKMTTEQWNLNRLKKFLMAPKEEIVFQARGSSVCQGRLDQWGPKLAINGKISNGNCFYFHSEYEMNPWLEVKLPSPVLISSVTIINRKNNCWERLVNVEIRAGMAPVPDGFTAQERGADANKKLEINSRCGFFAGPPDGFAKDGHTIFFDRPILAQYITLQILGTEILQINGLKINGGDLLNYYNCF